MILHDLYERYASELTREDQECVKKVISRQEVIRDYAKKITSGHVFVKVEPVSSQGTVLFGQDVKSTSYQKLSVYHAALLEGHPKAGGVKFNDYVLGNHILSVNMSKQALLDLAINSSSVEVPGTVSKAMGESLPPLPEGQLTMIDRRREKEKNLSDNYMRKLASLKDAPEKRLTGQYLDKMKRVIRASLQGQNNVISYMDDVSKMIKSNVNQIKTEAFNALQVGNNHPLDDDGRQDVESLDDSTNPMVVELSGILSQEGSKSAVENLLRVAEDDIAKTHGVDWNGDVDPLIDLVKALRGKASIRNMISDISQMRLQLDLHRLSSDSYSLNASGGVQKVCLRSSRWNVESGLFYPSDNLDKHFYSIGIFNAMEGFKASGPCILDGAHLLSMYISSSDFISMLLGRTASDPVLCGLTNMFGRRVAPDSAFLASEKDNSDPCDEVEQCIITELCSVITTRLDEYNETLNKDSYPGEEIAQLYRTIERQRERCEEKLDHITSLSFSP
jgi:hypothetical protein